MGLQNNTTTNALYLSKGKVIRRCEEKDSTLVKNGKHYQEFDSISGTIKSIKAVDGYEGSKDLSITIADQDETYYLSFGVKSGYFRSFARSAKNIDFSMPLELVPVFKEEDGAKKSSLLVKQKGEWIKRYYTLDNKGEMPDAKPVELDGETLYDYKEQNDFLIKELITKFESEKLPF